MLWADPDGNGHESVFVGAEGSRVLMSGAEAEFWLQSVDSEVNPCEAALWHVHPEWASRYDADCVEVCVSGLQCDGSEA